MSSLMCSEEMMEESPDVSSELQERRLYNNQLPPEVILNHVEVTAFSDVNLLHNRAVFSAMLETEKVCVACVQNYFGTVQDDLTPEMKTDVAVWMFEVCEEEKMHISVFLRAAQYVDKFLSLQKISRYNFQLLGAVCILISSKIAGTTISPQKLVGYTANSVQTDMLLEWERLVLGILKWDMYGIVSADFVHHILNFLPKKYWDTPVISERIKTFIAYCAVDYQFGAHLPSIIASASIVAALKPFLSSDNLNQVLSTMNKVTDIDINVIINCMHQIISKVEVTVEGKRKASPEKSSCVETTTTTSSSTESDNSPVNSSTNGCGIKAR